MYIYFYFYKLVHKPFICYITMYVHGCCSPLFKFKMSLVPYYSYKNRIDAIWILGNDY